MMRVPTEEHLVVQVLGQQCVLGGQRLDADLLLPHRQLEGVLRQRRQVLKVDCRGLSPPAGTSTAEQWGVVIMTASKSHGLQTQAAQPAALVAHCPTWSPANLRSSLERLSCHAAGPRSRLSPVTRRPKQQLRQAKQTRPPRSRLGLVGGRRVRLCAVPPVRGACPAGAARDGARSGARVHEPPHRLLAQAAAAAAAVPAAGPAAQRAAAVGRRAAAGAPAAAVI